jgi:hypothetical protein
VGLVHDLVTKFKVF